MPAFKIKTSCLPTDFNFETGHHVSALKKKRNYVDSLQNIIYVQAGQS